MKINFSNLAKLFLAGVCFVAVGCTDYGQDIENLNNRIDALETDTIAPLAADLESVKEALEAAKSDLQSKIDANKGLIDGLTDALAEAKTDLQGQITANKNLIDALDSELDAAKTDLQGKIDTAVKEINGKIATLDKDVADLKEQDKVFAKQIADLDVAVKNNTAKIEELTKGLANEVKAREELQKALNDHLAIYATFVKDVDAKFQALNLEVEALKDKDIELKGLIDALDARLKANEALAEQNKKDIAQNAADIKANKELLDATIETLELLQAAHAALETRVGTLETAFDEYQKAIRAELDAHYAAFTEYTEKTDKAIADLVAENQAQQIAIDANLAAINNIKDVEIPALQAAIKAQEDALAAAKKELQDNIDDLAKVVEDYKAEMATIISGLDGRITENANQIKLTQESVKALKADLQAQIDKIDARVKTLEEKLAALEAKVQSLIDNEIKALQDGLSALKGRIQSLVFVPEYKDCMATVEYALFGTTKVEALSTFKYQVHPASCAAGVEAADLKFVFSEALKTRTATPELNVVDVKVVNEEKGIIAVTAKALNLHAVYEGTAEYAVSLVFSHKVNEVENNIASCYTTLIAEKEEKAAVITWSLNDGYKKAAELEYIATNTVNVLAGINVKLFVDGTETPLADVETAYGLKVVPQTEVKAAYAPEKYTSALDNTEKEAKGVYTNTIREDYGYDVKLNVVDKATVGMVETLTYGFDLVTVNDNAVVANLSDNATVEITKIKGYLTLDPQTITWARSKDNEADGITPINPTTRLVATVAGKLLNVNGEELSTAGTTYADIIADATKLKSITVNGAAIAAPYNVVLGGTNEEPTVLFEGFEWNKEYTIVASYEIDNMIAQISIVLTTVQNSDAVVLAPQTITWNYAADKASEKGADTFRAVETTADKAELYADVIANGKLISVTPGFVLTATGFEATAFAWNTEYTFTAEYALEDKLVTVTGSVKTVKEAFIDLVINLADAQWLLTKEFVNQSETPAESLEAFVAGLTNLGDITAAAYLKDIFVDNTYNVTVDQANGSTLANTKLVVDPTTGASIKSVYNIDDFTTIPTAVAYAYNVTTWYGQKISFTKNLNINLQPVEVTLAPETKKIAADLAFTTEAESLAALYESNVNVDKASIATADDFLKAIFVTNAPKSHEALANGAVLTDTKLVVDAAKGNTAVATYAYTDFTTTPETVVYKSTYKTWYGQDVTINKVVTIDWTTYNYEHIIYFVYDANGVYYSQPVRTNVNIPTLSTLLDAIIFSLDMNTAFKVVDSEGVKVEDLAAAGLVSTFDFTTAPADSDIHFAPGTNNLVYRGYDKTVGVKAQLKLVNSNGVETILPTNFDAGQKYAGYYVEQVNPVNKLEAADLKISVSSVLGKTYTYYAVNQLSLTDDRGKQLIAKGGIATENDVEVTYNEGGWVVGDGTEAVGFADGKSVADVYGLTAPVFECSEIPVDLQSALKFENGKLTFDNTNLIKLTKPVELTVKATIVHDWIVSDSVEFKVTIVVE